MDGGIGKGKMTGVDEGSRTEIGKKVKNDLVKQRDENWEGERRNEKKGDYIDRKKK